MRRSLVLALLILAPACKRSEPPAPADAQKAAPAATQTAVAAQPAEPAPLAAEQPAAATGGPAAEPVPPQPASAEATPAPPPADAPATPDEDEDDTIYSWTDAEGTTHFTTAGEVPPDRRPTARAASGNMVVVEAAPLDFVPSSTASPAAATPEEAPAPRDRSRPALDANGLPIPGTMDPTASTRAAQQAGATQLDPAAMERQRAVDNRRMHCVEKDGATICDGE